MSEADLMRALTVQLLEWVAERPRSYGETIDPWRTSCPRIAVWETALAEELVTISSGQGMRQAQISLTELGKARLNAALGSVPTSQST